MPAKAIEAVSKITAIVRKIVLIIEFLPTMNISMTLLEM